MSEIIGGLQDAANPLDFVKQNLERIKATQPITRNVEAISPPMGTVPPAAPAPMQTVQKQEVNPQDVVAIADAVRDAEKKESDESLKAIEKELTEAPESAAGSEKAEEVPAVQANDESAEEPDTQDSKEINFRALRKTVSEHKQQIAAKEKELEALKAEVEKYKTGEELPEPVKEKVSRIQELEYYEKLHALKKSPYYKEKFIKPLNDVRTALNEYAKDYEIPPEVLQQALNIRSKSQLNEFLSDHFDPVGAMEVKALIDKAHDISIGAEKAELEPLETMERLEQENKLIQEQEKQSQRVVISETSKQAWMESLLKIREEGKALELIPSETDPVRTKKYVEPILERAAKDYARTVKLLAENGLSKLPKELAFALARAHQLAVASAVSIERAAASTKHADEIEANTVRQTRYLRPAIGSTVGSGAEPSQPKTVDQNTAADMLLQQVMPGRR